MKVGLDVDVSVGLNVDVLLGLPVRVGLGVFVVVVKIDPGASVAGIIGSSVIGVGSSITGELPIFTK